MPDESQTFPDLGPLPRGAGGKEEAAWHNPCLAPLHTLGTPEVAAHGHTVVLFRLITSIMYLSDPPPLDVGSRSAVKDLLLRLRYVTLSIGFRYGARHYHSA